MPTRSAPAQVAPNLPGYDAAFTVLVQLPQAPPTHPTPARRNASSRHGEQVFIVALVSLYDDQTGGGLFRSVESAAWPISVCWRPGDAP